MGIVTQSSGDIWIHREKAELWWTTTKPDAASIDLAEPFEPNNDGTRMFIANKPCEPWSNKNQTGGSLIWSGLHPRAREFLFTEGTLQQLAPEHAEYAVALLAGKDLLPWHSLERWKRKVEESKKAPSRSLNPWERAVVRIVATVTATVAGSRGQEVIRKVKAKELRMSSLELEANVHALIRKQDGLCAITGIRLQADGDCDDDELQCSLDRIDSDGHYEIGNLQVVCRFVNRWKNDGNDEEFRRLVKLVRYSIGQN